MSVTIETKQCIARHMILFINPKVFSFPPFFVLYPRGGDQRTFPGTTGYSGNTGEGFVTFSPQEQPRCNNQIKVVLQPKEGKLTLISPF